MNTETPNQTVSDLLQRFITLLQQTTGFCKIVTTIVTHQGLPELTPVLMQAESTLHALREMTVSACQKHPVIGDLIEQSEITPDYEAMFVYRVDELWIDLLKKHPAQTAILLWQRKLPALAANLIADGVQAERAACAAIAKQQADQMQGASKTTNNKSDDYYYAGRYESADRIYHDILKRGGIE